MNPMIRGNVSAIRVVEFGTRGGSQRLFGGVVARKIACLLAWILCSLGLAHQARAQSCLEWSAGNECQAFDASIAAACHLSGPTFTTTLVTESQPRDVPSCGVAGDPLTSCVWLFSGITFGTPASGGNIHAGGTFDIDAIGSGGTCPQYFVSAVTPRTQVKSPDPLGHPINPAIGNVYTTETDVKVAGTGAIGFQRFYNSADLTGTDGVPGWRHSYGRSINTVYQTDSTSYPGQSAQVSALYSTPEAACTSGFTDVQNAVSAWSGATATYSGGVCTVATSSNTLSTLAIVAYPNAAPPATPVEYDVIRDDGQMLRYPVTTDGTVSNPPGVSMRLEVTGSGFTLTDDQDTVETYNAAGVLQSITSRAGVVQTLSYNSYGFWSGVTDSFGNSLSVTRVNSPAGNIVSIAVNSGGTVQYSYDSSQRLQTVTNLDGTTQSYVYGNSTFPNALTGEIDESGTTLSSWVYDSQERATSSTQAVGANAVTLAYNSDGSVTTTDALGAVRTFAFTRIGDINQNTSISGSQCPTCQDPAATTYDSYGWVASRTDYNGNLTCYANDPTRGLELVRVEGFAPGSTCPANLASYTTVSGTPQRMITTQWSVTWREPVLITEPNRTTSFTYDSSGNLLTKTITDTTVTPNVSRTWTYTYNTYGQVLTAQGPRTDVNSTTTYTYYTCSTGAQCGQVQSVTDAAGHVWTYNTYNVYGQPLTITDPNGVLNTLAYDARQRLKSRSIAGETTTFSYYPTGLLETVTLPDNSTLTYAYDGAHRLKQISDGLGNKIVYTLDALGNRTADNSYDPSGALHLTHTRVYNTLGELYQDINAANTAAVTTTYGYDSNGNQTSVAAPLSRNAASVYDALNRLSQITDPASGVTRFSYDSNSNLLSVTDPRSLTTSYAYNGFGDLSSQLSPDTGTTGNTYDSGGNLSTSTDARGAVSTYAYDALNRMTSVGYALGGTTDQTLSFTYDSGTNGNGRLTGASDASHSLSWGYDALGRVVSKSQTVGGVTKSVGYRYTSGDLTTLTTPSGQTVTYGYNGNHQITSITANGTTVLNGATYEPMGAVNGWTWGNSTTTARTYDGDEKISQISSNGVKGYTYDNASRITGITDTSTGAANWTYGYDLLDRIASGTNGATTRGWTYDANGNRLTETGTSPSTYSVAPGSNQISSISGTLARTYSYDASGHVLGYASMSATYNNAGRLKTVTNGSLIETLIYNALGQRIQTSGGASGTILYWYDEQGHLLGEYDGSGNLIEETVWLGDIPVATLQPSGSGVAIFYVHTDQLNTPRQVTRPADNTQMWTWFSDPFGTDAVNSNPAGAGSFRYNLRFAGQVFDGQVGLHYNYKRDYDPAVGRYVESDPIGLGGGANTYAYALGNPVGLVDPLGTQVSVAGPAIAVGGIAVICYASGACQGISEALQNMLSRARGRQDPVAGLPSVNPGRDCKGNCNPCPPPITWTAQGDAHGGTNNTHAHGIIYNQNKETCECFPHRVSAGTEDDIRNGMGK